MSAVFIVIWMQIGFSIHEHIAILTMDSYVIETYTLVTCISLRIDICIMIQQQLD